MPITVVVGGQFGSEGKGKVAHWFARELGAAAVVRVGGSNSGHTVVDEQGQRHVFRHLPTAAILPNVMCALAAGSYIDPLVLLDEVARIGLPSERLAIDPNAMVVTEADREAERQHRICDRIGSTGSGTGAAVARRLRREHDTVFAADHPDLQPFVRPTKPLLASLLQDKSRVLIEGTQGYGLSLLHSLYFPYVTSRDTTAAAFLAEVGLSPLDVDDVILVLRAYPIRVAGSSGPLPNETDWEAVAAQSGNDSTICERTSVTRQVRRVGHFDAGVVQHAILSNRPTRIVMNHLDHVDSKVRIDLSAPSRAYEFLSMVEATICRHIDFYGTSESCLRFRERTTSSLGRKACDGRVGVGAA